MAQAHTCFSTVLHTDLRFTWGNHVRVAAPSILTLERPPGSGLPERRKSRIDTSGTVHDDVLSQHVFPREEKRRVDHLHVLIDRGIEHAPAPDDPPLSVRRWNDRVAVVSELITHALGFHSGVERPEMEGAVGIADSR